MSRHAAILSACLCLAFALTGCGGSQAGRSPPQPAEVSAVRSNEANIPLDGVPTAVAAAESGAWVAVAAVGGGAELVRVDAESKEITASIDAPFSVADIAVVGERVWLLGHGGDRVVLATWDVESGSLGERMEVVCETDCAPNNLAASRERLWLTLESLSEPPHGEVVQVDVSTGTLVARTPIDGWPRDLVVAGDSVWVAAYTDFEGSIVRGASLVRVDVARGAVTGRLFAGEVLGSSTEVPPALARTDGLVWFVRSENRDAEAPRLTVVRLDPHRGRAVGMPIPVSRPLRFVGADGGGTWTSDGEVRYLGASRAGADRRFHFDAHVIDGAFDADSGTLWLATSDQQLVRLSVGEPGS